jgi:formate/nitrite transporter FocA (FNT family)
MIFKGMHPEITQTMTTIATAKFSKSILDLIISGFFCNVLVCFASWYGRKTSYLGSLFVVVLIPVVTFILCGFEHSIADVFFVSYATGEWTTNLLKLLAIVLGNVLGGLAFSVIKVRPILDNILDE